MASPSAMRRRPALYRAARRIDSLALRAVWRWFGRLFSALLDLSVFAAVALATGFGSVWYMTEIGTGLTTDRLGPWSLWRDAARPTSDPYTRAHVLGASRLPVPASHGQYLTATRDSSGSRLYGDCEYEIVGRGPDAQWWSLAVYDLKGNLIPHPAERYAVSSATALRDSAGTFTVRLARDARPGNWLPVGTDGGIALVLRVYLPEPPAGPDLPTISPAEIPAINRIECR